MVYKSYIGIWKKWIEVTFQFHDACLVSANHEAFFIAILIIIKIVILSQ